MSTFVALTFFASVAAAQQPCTTDANRVVSELYRHILERQPDAGAQSWAQQLASGRTTVRELVRTLAKSQEHEQRFGQGEAGESTRFERAVARYYRHILGRQPDPEGQRAHAEGAQRGGLDTVVDSLVNSQEYTNNFGDWEAPGSGGVTFCANASTSNAPAAQPQPRAQVGEPRFRGMDRNRDGQVTRAEWSGSAQSFRVHDWNGNGVLDGDEVRQGAFRQGRDLDFEDFDRGETFADLDTNNNNRIEEREWHASLNAFDRLDANGDRVLSAAEVAAANPNAARGAARRANDYNFDALDVNNNNRIERREWLARGDIFNTLDIDRNNVLSRAEVESSAPNQRGGVGTTGDSVVVDSSVRWTDTGINVRAGQTLTFDADGEIRLSEGRTDLARPSGSTSGRRAGESPIPNAPAGGLIARIGNGSPTYVGDRRALRAPASGRLYLSVNDDYLADNSGQYRVTINVR
jgi:hypothetical protein